MQETKTDAVGDIAPDGELELGSVGRALWRKKWLVLGPTLLVALIAFGAVNLITPRYKSEARILIDGRENVFLRPEAEKIGDRDRSVVDQEAVTSQVQLALSRDLARTVIRQLKLGERPEFDPMLRSFSPLVDLLRVVGLAKDPLSMTPEERVLDAYYDRLTVYPVDKSRVIAIELQSSDPDLAAQVANAVAEGYLAMQQAARQDQTRAAGKWLAGEIDDLRKKVGEAEAKVESFRAKSNLFVGTNNTTLSNQQLGEINSQLGAARTLKAEAESKARFIRELLRSGQSLESAEFLNSELIRRLAEQRVMLRGQLAEQQATLLDGHPRIKELKAQIADLERQIRGEAERLARSLENDARIASARLDSVTSNLDQLKRLAASTNEQDIQLRALEREAKAQRDLLESYLAKYRETTARESLSAMPTEVRIISRAVVSSTPYFPRKLPIVLIATLATLLVASGFITTGELLAGNVHRPALDAAEPATIEASPALEVEPAADLASAAEAPARLRLAGLDGAPAEGHRGGPKEPGPDDPLAEIAAALRQVAAGGDQPVVSQDPVGDLAAALRAAGEAGRRVVIAGAARQVGASGIALALARRLAEGARVVLVDLALGNPSLAAIMVDPAAPGIADLVRGTVSFGAIISRDQDSRVHVIAAGQVAADSAAIVASERLRIAVDALARTYDHVVIDAGALPEIAVEPFARLSPHAVLVAPEAAADAAAPLRERLAAAGFADVTVHVATAATPETDPAAQAVAA